MWNDRDIPLAYLTTFRCYGPGYMATTAAPSIVSIAATAVLTLCPVRIDEVITIKR